MIVLDSYALISAIGQNPHIFGDIDTRVQKQALALLAAQLKQRSLKLEQYIAISGAIGHKQLELYLDTVDDKFLSALIKKLDRYSLAATSSDPNVLRQHLVNLATVKSLSVKMLSHQNHL